MIYRHQITIQDHSTTVNSFGELDNNNSSSWTTYTKRRAAIKNPSAREFRNNDQITAEATHVIEIRRDSTTKTITPDMRIQWLDDGDERILNISQIIIPDEKRRRLLLVCKEAI